MELFAKIVKGQKALIILAESSILDIWRGSECVHVIVKEYWKPLK